MNKPLSWLGMLIPVLAFSIAGCRPAGQGVPPPLCPQATPEWLRVDPVTSPTDQLSQAIHVRMGNCEAVTITVESGTFSGTCYPGQVDIDLLPHTIHHLEVVASVRKIRHSDGCEYGGYTLHTTKDQNGAPLIIQQGQPAAPRAPTTRITPDNAGQLEPLLAISPEARLVTDFAFRGEDEFVSVGYVDKISRWRLATGEQIDPVGEGFEALCLAIAPDGSLIATGGTAEDRAVRLWQVATGEMMELGRHESYVGEVAFSPAGSRLASGDNADRVWIWDVASGEPIRSFEGDVPQRLQAFSRLYWLDEDRLIAAASDAIYWWDVAGGRQTARLARPEAALFFVEVAFGPGGDSLAAAAQDENVYVWSHAAPEWALWPAPPGTDLRHVEFSPDGRLLAATTSEGKLLLWEVATQELVAHYAVASSDVAALHFSPNGYYLGVGGWDSPIWLWGIP